MLNHIGYPDFVKDYAKLDKFYKEVGCSVQVSISVSGSIKFQLFTADIRKAAHILSNGSKGFDLEPGKRTAETDETVQ